MNFLGLKKVRQAIIENFLHQKSKASRHWVQKAKMWVNLKSSVYFFQTLASTPVLICINTTGDNSITTGLWCYTWTWRLVSNDLSLLKEKITKQPHRAPPNAMVLYVTLCMLNLLLILFEGIKVWYFLPPNINKSNNYCTLLLLHIIRASRYIKF